jgi:hypothetical protein
LRLSSAASLAPVLSHLERLLGRAQPFGLLSERSRKASPIAPRSCRAAVWATASVGLFRPPAVILIPYFLTFTANGHSRRSRKPSPLIQMRHRRERADRSQRNSRIFSPIGPQAPKAVAIASRALSRTRPLSPGKSHLSRTNAHIQGRSTGPPPQTLTFSACFLLTWLTYGIYRVKIGPEVWGTDRPESAHLQFGPLTNELSRPAGDSQP